MSLLQRDAKFPTSSRTYAVPFDIPAPKFRPTGPSTTTTPAVMYSQQWFPAPSMTAAAPQLRTANPSPARPAADSFPPVAPYRAVLPRITVRGGAPAYPASRDGLIAISPPARPLPPES